MFEQTWAELRWTGGHPFKDFKAPTRQQSLKFSNIQNIRVFEILFFSAGRVVMWARVVERQTFASTVPSSDPFSDLQIVLLYFLMQPDKFTTAGSNNSQFWGRIWSCNFAKVGSLMLDCLMKCEKIEEIQKTPSVSNNRFLVQSGAKCYGML